MKLTLSLIEVHEIIRKHTGIVSDVEIEILHSNGNPLGVSLTADQLRGINATETCMREGNKIAAIKEYRTIARIGLWEAKSVVENWDLARKIIDSGRLATAQHAPFGRSGIEIVALP